MMAVADSNARVFTLISLSTPLSGGLEFGDSRLPGICKPLILSLFGFGVCVLTHRASFVRSTYPRTVIGVSRTDINVALV